MQRLSLQVWSDIACPWCYVGKRRFEAALALFEHREQVEVSWRAFELDPSAPRTLDADVSYAERLARKYATTLDRGQEMIGTMTAAGAAEGLDFHFERIRPGNTFDAHRLLAFAAERGQGEAAREKLFRAYLTEGLAIGEREVLARLAGELEHDPGEVRAMLDSAAYEQEVRADEQAARDRGIGGVPFFLVGGRGVSGAQPPEVLAALLAEAWERT